MLSTIIIVCLFYHITNLEYNCEQETDHHSPIVHDLFSLISVGVELVCGSEAALYLCVDHIHV